MMRIIWTTCSTVCLVLGSLLGIVVGGAACAEEGFFEPNQRQFTDQMQAHAVVKMGPCSAILLSPNGLLMTTQQCLQQQLNRRLPINVIEQGLVATSQASELPLSLTGPLVLSSEEASTPIQVSDVRLVFIPPMQNQPNFNPLTVKRWPTHNTDFVFVRAYTNNAEPISTPHYLALSEYGVAANETLATLAYPHGSRRHEPAVVMHDYFAETLPTESAVLGKWRTLLEQALGQTSSDLSPSIESAYARQLEQLTHAKTLVDEKIRQAKRSQRVPWRLLKNSAMQSNNELVDPRFAQLINQRKQWQAQLFWLNVISRSPVIATSIELYHFAMAEQGNENTDAVIARSALEQQLLKLNETYHAETDFLVWQGIIAEYSKQPRAVRSSQIDRWLGISSNQTNTPTQLQSGYFDSLMHDVDARIRALASDFSELKSNDDYLLALAKQIIEQRQEIIDQLDNSETEFNELVAQYHSRKATSMRYEGEQWYAEANGDLRVSFGKVVGSVAEDGLLNLPFTHLSAAHNTAPHNNKSRPHNETPTNSEAKLVTHFLTSNDATTGSIGGAVINRQGQLVGMLTDGTGAGINATWYYDAELSRAININSRFILWTLKQSENAQRLLAELTRAELSAAEISSTVHSGTEASVQ